MDKVARLLAVAGLIAASVPVTASMPSGRSFGPWRVSGISSLSGVGPSSSDQEGDDGPFVVLFQDNDGAGLKAEWGHNQLHLTIYVDDCVNEQEFFQTYKLDHSAIHRSSKKQLVSRITADFSNWVSQARFACERDEKVKLLTMRSLPAAAAYFVDIIY